MDWLKNLIGEENYNKLQFSDEQKEKLKKTQTFDPEKHIPKDKFNEKSEKVKELEKQVESLTNEKKELEDEKEKENQTGDEKINKLQNKLDDLQKKLNENEKAVQERDKRLEVEKKRSILHSKLTEHKANPKYLKFLESEFDIENLEIDKNGSIKDFDEKIQAIKENDKELFGEYELSGSSPSKGGENKKPQKLPEDNKEALKQIFSQ